MKSKQLLAAAAALVLAGTMASCSSGGPDDSGGNDTAACTNNIPKPDLPVVTVWAWYPNSETVADNFNEQHDDVQVCWTNAGAGGDEYDKLQTAITAGTGAPDVVMVEADRVAVYQIQGALVDLSDLGYEGVKDSFSDGVWKDWSIGGGVYGAPVDGGPMAMIYRKDVFAQYGITPPTTWAEYEAAADGQGCRWPALR